MNNIQIFKYENNDVRTVEMNGEPWFVGKDVASVLGYKDTVNALKTHVNETVLGDPNNMHITTGHFNLADLKKRSETHE